jgi:hypothetical protein
MMRKGRPDAATNEDGEAQGEDKDEVTETTNKEAAAATGSQPSDGLDEKAGTDRIGSQPRKEAGTGEKPDRTKEAEDVKAQAGSSRLSTTTSKQFFFIVSI